MAVTGEAGGTMRGSIGFASIVEKAATLAVEDILIQLHCFEGRLAYLRGENSTVSPVPQA